MIATVDVRYVLLMLAAIVVGGLLLRRSQEKLPLAGWQKLTLGLGAFCGAMLSAKLPFLLFGGSADGVWFSDGKTIMSGIVGAYLGVEMVKWTLDIRTKTGDSFAAPAAVAVCFGRLACFTAGCCYGLPTTLPWGVVFPTSGDLQPRHPTQLYEATFHFVAAAIIIVLRRRGIWRNQLAKAYILAYLAYRFITEEWRPEPPLFAGLTAYQWAAIGLAPVFLALWYRDAKSLRATRYEASPGTNSHP